VRAFCTNIFAPKDYKAKKTQQEKSCAKHFCKKMRKMLVKLTHGGLEGSEGAIPILIKIL